MKKISQPDHRGSTAPTIGAASERLDPTIGAIEAVLAPSPAPTIGDDVSTPVMARKNLCGVERFKARIGGRLTLPERESNPLGRIRSIKLFKTMTAHLIAHHHGRTGHYLKEKTQCLMN